MGWATGRYCFDSQQRKGILLFYKASRRSLEPNHPHPLLNRHRVQFSQGRVEGRETDQSPRSIDEIRSEWRAQEHVFLLLHFHFIGWYKENPLMEHLHTATTMQYLNFINNCLKASKNTRYWTWVLCYFSNFILM